MTQYLSDVYMSFQQRRRGILFAIGLSRARTAHPYQQDIRFTTAKYDDDDDDMLYLRALKSWELSQLKSTYRTTQNKKKEK